MVWEEQPVVMKALHVGIVRAVRCGALCWCILGRFPCDMRCTELVGAQKPATFAATSGAAG